MIMMQQAVEMLAQGMAGIFEVLGLIALIVKFRSWTDNRKK